MYVGGRDIPGVSHNKWTPPIALFKLPADHFSLSFYRKLPQDDIYNNSPTSFATRKVLDDPQHKWGFFRMTQSNGNAKEIHDKYIAICNPVTNT